MQKTLILKTAGFNGPTQKHLRGWGGGGQGGKGRRWAETWGGEEGRRGVETEGEGRTGGGDRGEGRRGEEIGGG